MDLVRVLAEAGEVLTPLLAQRLGQDMLDRQVGFLKVDELRVPIALLEPFEDDLPLRAPPAEVERAGPDRLTELLVTRPVAALPGQFLPQRLREAFILGQWSRRTERTTCSAHLWECPRADAGQGTTRCRRRPRGPPRSGSRPSLTQVIGGHQHRVTRLRTPAPQPQQARAELLVFFLAGVDDPLVMPGAQRQVPNGFLDRLLARHVPPAGPDGAGRRHPPPRRSRAAAGQRGRALPGCRSRSAAPSAARPRHKPPPPCPAKA